MTMNQEALAMAINKLAEEIARLNVELALQKAQNIEKEQTINSDYALSNSFGFGGHNACLLFKRI